METTFYVSAMQDLLETIALTPDIATMPKRLMYAKIHEPTKFEGTGRNKPCPCGSGLKFKRCCERQPQTEHQ